MRRENTYSSGIHSRQSLTDKWLNFILVLFTGQHAFVEFNEIETEKRKISKVRRFYRRGILRPVKQVLRFVVFGIEDALNERKNKNIEHRKINDNENRFKTDKQ